MLAQARPGDGWIFGDTWASADFALGDTVPGKDYFDAFLPDRPVAILNVAPRQWELEPEPIFPIRSCEGG